MEYKNIINKFDSPQNDKSRNVKGLINLVSCLSDKESLNNDSRYQNLLELFHLPSAYRFENLPDRNFQDILRMQLGEDYLYEMYYAALDEYLSLRDILHKQGLRLNQVVDLGSGLGRSTVFFYNMFKWRSVNVMLVDGTKKEQDVLKNKKDDATTCSYYQTGFHKTINYEESVYNNFQLAEKFLTSNHVENYSLVTFETFAHDARNIDLLYSFHSVGYHFDIKEMCQKLSLNEKMKTGGIMIFGIRNREQQKQLNINYDFNLGDPFKLIALIEGTHRQDFAVFERV